MTYAAPRIAIFAPLARDALRFVRDAETRIADDELGFSFKERRANIAGRKLGRIMDVKLDSETEKLVQKEIEAGRFPDARVLVGTAVQHYLIAREFGEEYTREEIQQKIERGWTQLEAGQSVDGEKLFEQLRIRGHELKSRGK